MLNFYCKVTADCPHHRDPKKGENVLLCSNFTFYRKLLFIYHSKQTGQYAMQHFIFQCIKLKRSRINTKSNGKRFPSVYVLLLMFVQRGFLNLIDRKSVV